MFAEIKRRSKRNNLLRHPDRRLMRLGVDTGGVQSQRVLRRLIEQQQAATGARPIVIDNVVKTH